MKTTNTLSNRNLAAELLQVRNDLKTMKARETELKKHFSNLIGPKDACLKVGTAIVISKYEGTRRSWNTELLTEFINDCGLSLNGFRNVSNFSTIKVASC